VKNNESPRTKRQLQAAESKERLYQSAVRLIEEIGFEKMTVQSICRKAGVSKGLFYHYYNSKYDLIIEGYSDFDQLLEQQFRARNRERNTLEQILEIIRIQMSYAVDLGIDLIIQIYKSQMQHSTEFFLSPDRTLPSILMKTVEEGQSKGEITGGMSSSYITNYILRFTRGLIYDWCLHKGDYDLQKTAVEDAGKLLAIFSP